MENQGNQNQANQNNLLNDVLKYTPSKITTNKFKKFVKTDLIKHITYDLIKYIGCNTKHKKTLSEKEFNELFKNKNWLDLEKSLNIDGLIFYLINNQNYYYKNFECNLDALTYKYFNGFYPLEIENILNFENKKEEAKKNDDLFFKAQNCLKEIFLKEGEIINKSINKKGFKYVIEKFNNIFKMIKPTENDLLKQKVKIIFGDKTDIILNILCLYPAYNFMVYDENDYYINGDENDDKIKIIVDYKEENKIQEFYLNTFGDNKILLDVVKEKYEILTEQYNYKLNKGKLTKPIYKNGYCFNCMEDETQIISNFNKCKCHNFICGECLLNSFDDGFKKCGICKNETNYLNIAMLKPYINVYNEYKEIIINNSKGKHFLFIKDKNNNHNEKFKLIIWFDYEEQQYKYTTINMIQDYNLINEIQDYYINAWYDFGLGVEFIINWGNIIKYKDNTERIIKETNLKAISGGYDDLKSKNITFEEFKINIKNIIDFDNFIEYLIYNEPDDLQKNILSMYNIDYDYKFDMNFCIELKNNKFYYSSCEKGDINDLFSADFPNIADEFFS